MEDSFVCLSLVVKRAYVSKSPKIQDIGLYNKPSLASPQTLENGLQCNAQICPLILLAFASKMSKTKMISGYNWSTASRPMSTTSILGVDARNSPLCYFYNACCKKPATKTAQKNNSERLKVPL